jgi:hypothetical protein
MQRHIILYILLIFGFFIIFVLGSHYLILIKERTAMSKTLELLEKEMAAYKSRLETFILKNSLILARSH